MSKLRAPTTAWLLAVSLGLAGCSQLSGLFGGDEEPTAAAQSEEEFPNLATVPDAPPPVMPRAERDRIAEGLLADRANAEYTEQSLPDLVPDLPGAEPPPPPPAEEETKGEGDESTPEAEASATLELPAEPPAPEPAPVEPVDVEPVALPDASEAAAPAASESGTEIAALQTPDAGEAAPTEQLPAPDMVTVDMAALDEPAESAGQPVGVVYFTDGSAAVPGEGLAVLREVARMQQESGGHLRIVGHASGGGGAGDTADMLLSMERANAVARELAGLGVGAEMLRLAAAGAAAPAFDESTPAGEAGNQRAEIYLE